MNAKKLTYKEALELASLLKDLALVTKSENLIENNEIFDLPKNIIKVMNIFTNDDCWNNNGNFIKAMASVLLSETITGVSAEELMDNDITFFKEKYHLSKQDIYSLEILL